MNNSVFELFLRVLLLSFLLMVSEVVSATVLDAGSQICGIQADNTVVCWGGGNPLSGTFSQISVGSGHACGVRTDNTLACWGNNAKGQATPPNGSFSQVSASNQYSCGVLTDNTVVCWGNNSHGQATPPNGTFSQVSAAKEHTCGILTDSTVACWGNNSHGQTTPPSGTFSQISPGGTFYTCGIRTDNTSACWGASNGAIKDGIFKSDGRDVPPIGTFSQVSAAISWFTCWLRTDNAVLCSGTNEFENSEDLRSPNSTCTCPRYCVCESPSGMFSHVSTGEDTCAIKMDNTVICWGKGKKGELMLPAGLIVKSSDPEACLLYGVHDDGDDTQFFIINSGTSEVHARSKLDENHDIKALDIHPLTNQIYAASSGDENNNGHFYEVRNGAQSLEDVGEIRFKEVEGLAFHPDGMLWGWAQDAGLFQINSGENNEPNPEAVEVILPYDRKAEEVVEFKVNDLTWNLGGTILYGIGRVLYKNQFPDNTHTQPVDKLWTYNASEGTVSTVCDNLMDSLDNVKALETLLDDTLLLGSTKNEKLIFWTLDVQTCNIIRREEMATAYHDIKGVARPDCSYPYVDDANLPNK
jgi:hypothetical protein